MQTEYLQNFECRHRVEAGAGKAVLVLGDGVMSSHWRRLLSAFDWPFNSRSDHDEQAVHALDTAISDGSYRAILWHGKPEPEYIVRKLSRLPRTIPLLLRYQPECQGKPEPALLKKMDRRSPAGRLSLPLRFWPPACRLWEIVATEVYGKIHDIESTMHRPEKATEANTWHPAIHDLIDFFDCLMGEPSKQTSTVSSEKGATTTAEYSGHRTASIRQTTTSGHPAIGIHNLKVKAAHGELVLTMAPDRTVATRQPGKRGLRTTTAAWLLHRRPSLEISPRPLAPATVFAGDPVALELRCFMRQLT